MHINLPDVFDIEHTEYTEGTYWATQVKVTVINDTDTDREFRVRYVDVQDGDRVWVERAIFTDGQPGNVVKAGESRVMTLDVWHNAVSGVGRPGRPDAGLRVRAGLTWSTGSPRQPVPLRRGGLPADGIADGDKPCTNAPRAAIGAQNQESPIVFSIKRLFQPAKATSIREPLWPSHCPPAAVSAWPRRTSSMAKSRDGRKQDTSPDTSPMATCSPRTASGCRTAS